ncbi:hypothetical protein A3218_17925 [Pseudomonas chlororaphis]|uniref:hypothetical protein n=1 Tax=Pseudomonas chlororaphis TaxID=587753 RepID=UPI000789EB4F|nr:hypothetical protein [Pseudomonas chlororaphis]AMS16093.1 hypothetical protein A3218_17925 [Pseudomonas chlororaphis]
MMHTRRFSPLVLRALFVSAMASAATGCSMANTESFTFQAEVPENFVVDGTAYYIPAPGETCKAPSGEERKGPGRKVFKTEQPKTAHLVDFKVPLTDTGHGCSMVLKSLELGIEGQWGKRDLDMSLESAGISISDDPSESPSPLPSSAPLVFQGQCQWLFRTVGSKRFIRKILQCRALDANGVMQKNLIGTTVQRTQLAGRTVKLVLSVAEKEQPYFGRSWLETSKGWKPCIETKETFRCQSPPIFTDFKMPDGRDCTVYPNCTE